MTVLLVKNIALLATFDDIRREIVDGALLVRDNVSDKVATTVIRDGHFVKADVDGLLQKHEAVLERIYAD